MKLRFLHIVFALLPYLLVAQVNVQAKGEMPSELEENSGLIYYNNKLITHNDSGNNPELFEIDTVSLSITRTIALSNGENVDWEDITQDDTYIYIGDIGNNRGTRTDLVIYRISKQDYNQSESIIADRIDFNYEDQIDFDDNGNSDWDAEALFVLNNQLVLLTKQWESFATVAYAIPKTPGTYTATKIDEYAIDGLVTGASYNTISNELFVLGHSNLLQPFVYKIEGATDTGIFRGAIEKLEFDIGFAQVEGITYINESRFFISSEYFMRDFPAITLEPTLFALQLQKDEDIPEISGPGPNPNEQLLVIYNNIDSNHLDYNLMTDKSVMARAIFDTSGKMVRFDLGSDIDSSTIDLSTYSSAVYYLTFYLGDSVISKSFIRN